MIDSQAEILTEVQNTVEYERSQYASNSDGNGHGDLEGVDETRETIQADGITPPQFPLDCWPPLFQKYLAIVENTTEAPDSYHLISFAAAVGATLRKRLKVCHARDVFPNFYIVLIGPTGAARKDTAFSRVRKLLDYLHKEDIQGEDPKFEIIPGIGSIEGLLTALNGTGKTVILNESEFLSLMSKAKQDKSSNLIPKLTSLWDCPPFETLRTRHNPLKCDDPFLSIVSGSTITWLSKSLQEPDVKGGFANRFIYIPGEIKGPIAFPPKPDENKLTDLIAEINQVRLWSQEMADEERGELFVPESTKHIFEPYYLDYHRRLRNETLISDLIQRIQTYCWKFALVFAAVDYSHEIKPIHLEQAITIADFLERAITHVFTSFGDSPSRQKEQKFIRFIQARGGGPIPLRDVYSGLHWSTAETEHVTEPLKKNNMIRISSKKALNGKDQKFVELFY